MRDLLRQVIARQPEDVRASLQKEFEKGAVWHPISSANPETARLRLALSPDGEIAHVTARNSDALLVFATRKLREDPAHALIDSVTVGIAPVGVAVIDDGKRIDVANSNRFARGPAHDEDLTVLEASATGRGGTRVIGRIPAGVFLASCISRPTDGR